MRTFTFAGLSRHVTSLHERSLTITFTSAGLSRHVTSLHERSSMITFAFTHLSVRIRHKFIGKSFRSVACFIYSTAAVTLYARWIVISERVRLLARMWLRNAGSCDRADRLAEGLRRAVRDAWIGSRVWTVVCRDARLLKRCGSVCIEMTEAKPETGTPVLWCRDNSREHPCSGAGIIAENARAVD